MKYNLKTLTADHKRLATNMFWSYLLEKLGEARNIQGIVIGSSTAATLDEIRYEQGRFNQMNPEVLEAFIDDLVFNLKEAIKSG